MIVKEISGISSTVLPLMALSIICSSIVFSSFDQEIKACVWIFWSGSFSCWARGFVWLVEFVLDRSALISSLDSILSSRTVTGVRLYRRTHSGLSRMWTTRWTRDSSSSPGGSRTSIEVSAVEPSITGLNSSVVHAASDNWRFYFSGISITVERIAKDFVRVRPIRTEDWK